MYKTHPRFSKAQLVYMMGYIPSGLLHISTLCYDDAQTRTKWCRSCLRDVVCFLLIAWCVPRCFFFVCLWANTVWVSDGFIGTVCEYVSHLCAENYKAHEPQRDETHRSGGWRWLSHCWRISSLMCMRSVCHLFICIIMWFGCFVLFYCFHEQALIILSGWLVLLRLDVPVNY